MISSCQLTLLFLTLAFKACGENLRQTLSDMSEREDVTTFTISPTYISPSFLSLLQCNGHGGAVFSSPWVPFYYFCAPPDFAVLSKASVCSLSPEFLALGACCSIKAKSWIHGIYTPLVLLLTNNRWVQATRRAAEVTLCRTRPGAALLLGFPPLSTSLSPSFKVSPGSTSLINHFQAKFLFQGLNLRNLTKTSIKESQRWSWGCAMVTVEEEEGGVMAKLPWSCCYGDRRAELYHKVAFFQVWCCCGNTAHEASKNTLF